jgi:hypothetical protein
MKFSKFHSLPGFILFRLFVQASSIHIYMLSALTAAA